MRNPGAAMILQLRRPERADLDVLVDWMGDAEFRQFMFGDSEEKAVHMAQQMMGMMSTGLALPMSSLGNLLIEDPNVGPVGIVLLQEPSLRNRASFVAIYLATPHRTGENVEAAIQCVFAYCFDEMNLHRAGIKVESGQTEYIRACERIGLTREFAMPQHVLRDGKGIDVYGFGMLRAEFDKIRVAAAGA